MAVKMSKLFKVAMDRLIAVCEFLQSHFGLEMANRVAICLRKKQKKMRNVKQS